MVGEIGEQRTFIFQPLDDLVISTIRNFAALYPLFADDVNQITAHLEAGESFKALKIGHKLLAGQEKATPDSVAPPPAMRSAAAV